jgi:hypothetical protein
MSEQCLLYPKSRHLAVQSNVRFGPLADIALFDHLVGAGEQRWWHGETEGPRGLEVNHQLVLGRCLHWQVGRILAPENAIDVPGRASVLIDPIGPVGNQPAGGDKDTVGVDGWQMVPGCEPDNQFAIIIGLRTPGRDQAAIRHACERNNRTLDLTRVAQADWTHFHPKGWRAQP